MCSGSESQLGVDNLIYFVVLLNCPVFYYFGVGIDFKRRLKSIPTLKRLNTQIELFDLMTIYQHLFDQFQWHCV